MIYRSIQLTALPILVLLLHWGTACTAAHGIVTVQAEDTNSPVVITDVQFGFEGRYKVGNWFPLAVTIKGTDQPVSGQLSVTVPDSTGAICDYVQTSASEIQIAAGQSVTTIAYVRSGRVNGTMQLTFTTSDGHRARQTITRDQFPTALLASQRLIVGVGRSIGCRDALVRHPQPNNDRIFYSQIQDVGLLPNQSCGYDGVDVIVLTTSELQILQRLSPGQWQAIEDWVRLGGRLIVTMGIHGDQLLATDHPLATLVPGRFSRISRLHQTGGLENYAKSQQRLDLLYRDQAGEEAGPRVTLLDRVDGVVEAYEGRGQHRTPLVVHGPHGFGRVVFVAIDLDRSPVDDWAGRVPLVTRLLELAMGPFLELDDEGPQRRRVNVGYEDLTGQLRMALDQFDSVRRLPFLAIATLATLYVLFIGPGDYFFVRRVLHRVQGTWLTFPLLVLFFGGAALWLTRQPDSGPLIMNQLEIVDLDGVTGTYRGSTWSHLYSRNAAEWNVAIRVDEHYVGRSDDQRGRGGALVGWQGLPGTGFGGMNDSQRNSNSWQTYSIVGRGFGGQPPLTTRIDSLPISKGSTRSLFGRWWGSGPVHADTELDENSDETVTGKVTNPWNSTLRDTWLVHGRWYYPLGTLAPGQSTEITNDTRPRNLKSLLARRKIIDSKDVSTPWDIESPDIPRLVEMLMFHEAAGGRSYTTLRHQHQHDLDISSQLSMSRAVLVGRSAERITEWDCGSTSDDANMRPVPSAAADDRHDGTPSTSINASHSFFRVLLPVNRYQRKPTSSSSM